MLRYDFEADEEMRVVEEGDYKGLGIRKSVRAPSEVVRGIAGALKVFRDNMEILMAGFMEESKTQEDEISSQIEHADWFLKEHKNIGWDANQMFDRLRLLYTTQIDSLKRERRKLRRERIKQKMTFMKELLDANKELSPFGKLI